MKARYLIPALALSACASFETPEARYFALTGAVTATARVAEKYADDCHTRSVTDPCYGRLPAINTGAKQLQKALEEADRVFVTKDSQYYSLSLTVAENALNNLRNLLRE